MKLYMKIQKIYSDTDRLYSVLLTQKEFSIFSFLKKKKTPPQKDRKDYTINVKLQYPKEFQRIRDAEWRGAKSNIDRYKNIQFIKSEYKKVEKEKGIRLPQEFWKLLDILPKFLPVAKKLDPDGKFILPFNISAINIYRYPDAICLVDFDVFDDLLWQDGSLYEGFYKDENSSIKSHLLAKIWEAIESVNWEIDEMEEPGDGELRYLQALEDFIKKNL